MSKTNLKVLMPKDQINRWIYRYGDASINVDNDLREKAIEEFTSLVKSSLLQEIKRKIRKTETNDLKGLSDHIKTQIVSWDSGYNACVETVLDLLSSLDPAIEAKQKEEGK